MKCGQAIDQKALGEHPADGEAHEPVQFGSRVEPAQHRERGLVHHACLVEHRLAVRGERVAVGAAIEQRASHRRLEARDPARHRRMVDAQVARGRRQGAAARERHEVAHVLPV